MPPENSCRQEAAGNTRLRCSIGSQLYLQEVHSDKRVSSWRHGDALVFHQSDISLVV